ncbi:MAG TPA: hypothetical protein VMU26_10485 [Candidatus Polarisedimenticolia bacterium]|nr:hypothetical protein [Candidatus Polarisedimenticolia bacterium]
MKLQVLVPDPFALPAHDSHRLNHRKCGRPRLLPVPRWVRAAYRGRPNRGAGQLEMADDINSLWELRDENRRLDAHNRYGENPTVSKNRDTEQFMDRVELEYIQRLDTQEWHDFLKQYFRWKFMGSHLHERMMDLGQNSFEHLFSVSWNTRVHRVCWH